jgi:hypothetical protein
VDSYDSIFCTPCLSAERPGISRGANGSTRRRLHAVLGRCVESHCSVRYVVLYLSLMRLSSARVGDRLVRSYSLLPVEGHVRAVYREGFRLGSSCGFT